MNTSETHAGSATDFGLALLDFDERMQAIELSWDYARSLAADDWLSLRELAARNRIPLRIGWEASRPDLCELRGLPKDPAFPAQLQPVFWPQSRHV